MWPSLIHCWPSSDGASASRGADIKKAPLLPIISSDVTLAIDEMGALRPVHRVFRRSNQRPCFLVYGNGDDPCISHQPLRLGHLTAVDGGSA